MPDGAALDRYLEARSAIAERASDRAGLAACHELTDTLDEGLAALAASLHGVAVVAVGGYGRREQCRHSDVDVMLLVDGDIPDAATAVLYPLWDAGLKVGHSVRTVRDAVQAADQNVETLTALLDARLVAGDEALYEQFLHARRKFASRHARMLLEAMAEQHHSLVERERWQLQQPNVKTGRGGLRALQALHWLDAAEAIAAGDETPVLDGPLAAAQETLLATRNALHAMSERQNDRYRQDLAADVARWLSSDRERWGRRLFGSMSTIDAAAVERFGLTRPLPRRWWQRARPEATAAVERETGSDLDRLLARLRHDGPTSLDPLPPAEWLARLLPEWDIVRALPHIAPVHEHTVDAHVMRTVDEVRYAMHNDEDGTDTVTVAAALPEAEILLAALLHDIGKGHDGDHSEVGGIITERFCTRAGLDADMTRRLATVAEQHLLLPTVATRRDIADPRVISETAELVGDARTLRLLYLVSVADARATGPDVWSPWKAQLMRGLFERVLDVLSEDAPEAATAARLREEAAVEALSGEFTRAVVEDHLRQLPPSYVLGESPETIGHHLTLIAAAANGGETAVRRDALDGVDRMTVVTRDRPGILSLVAGTLTAHSANVLGGLAYTREDGIAIQVMHVNDALGRTIDDRRWGRILNAVPLALEGRYPVDLRLAETRATYHAVPRIQIPTSVVVDNNDSDRYSILEVHAADRLGLLYALTGALHDLSLDIQLAKVDTIGAEVVDAFYVLRQNGRRLEAPDEIERVRSRIEAAVAALDEAPE
jgi:[protein-PII] uridylyltransferase